MIYLMHKYECNIFSVKSPESFAIDCDTSGEEYSPYTHGGRAIQIKSSLFLQFVSYYVIKRLLCRV